MQPFQKVSEGCAMIESFRIKSKPIVSKTVFHLLQLMCFSLDNANNCHRFQGFQVDPDQTMSANETMRVCMSVYLSAKLQSVNSINAKEIYVIIITMIHLEFVTVSHSNVNLRLGNFVLSFFIIVDRNFKFLKRYSFKPKRRTPTYSRAPCSRLLLSYPITFIHSRIYIALLPGNYSEAQM